MMNQKSQAKQKKPEDRKNETGSARESNRLQMQEV